MALRRRGGHIRQLISGALVFFLKKALDQQAGILLVSAL
jgi:hypothetical protein